MQQKLIQTDVQKYFRCKSWRLRVEGTQEREASEQSQQCKYWNLEFEEIAPGHEDFDLVDQFELLWQLYV